MLVSKSRGCCGKKSDYVVRNLAVYTARNPSNKSNRSNKCCKRIVSFVEQTYKSEINNILYLSKIKLFMISTKDHTNLHLNTVQIFAIDNLLSGEPSGPLIRLADEFPHELLEGAVVGSALQNVLDLGEGLEAGGEGQVVCLTLEVTC